MRLPRDESRVHRDTPKRPSAAPRLLVELRRRAAEAPDGAVVATRAELAATLEVSYRTIQRARADLTAVGLIDVVDPDGPADWHLPNTYLVRF